MFRSKSGFGIREVEGGRERIVGDEVRRKGVEFFGFL